METGESASSADWNKASGSSGQFDSREISNAKRVSRTCVVPGVSTSTMRRRYLYYIEDRAQKQTLRDPLARN